MKDTLFIPTKIKVGFQSRNDTFTKKLAYVTYYDCKGTLRKEKSWNGWIDSKIPQIELDNSPTTGFVLNKKVGGYKSDWNFRQAHIRVYDPRGFEFEISTENLIFILENVDCIKGKGLDGSFVYSWYGSDLVLLPTSCTEYQSAGKFTQTQALKLLTKTKLQLEKVYTGKSSLDEFVYLGEYPVYFIHDQKPKYYVFYNITKKSYEYLTSLSKLVDANSTTTVSNFAQLVDDFLKSEHGQPVVSIECIDLKKYVVLNNSYYKEFLTHQKFMNTFVSYGIRPFDFAKYKDGSYGIDGNHRHSYYTRFASLTNGTINLNYDSNTRVPPPIPFSTKYYHAKFRDGSIKLIGADGYSLFPQKVSLFNTLDEVYEYINKHK